MTRGTLAIVTNDGLYKSIEFNGYMYITGCGRDAIKCLENVDEFAEFEDAIKEFNETHHNYDDEQLVYKENISTDSLLNMRNDYFKNWISDYVFIKNLSDNPIHIITTEEGVTALIDSYEIGVFNFGEVVDISNITSDLYDEIMEEYGNELLEEDLLYIINNGKNVCGIYKDEYDVGREWAIEVYGIENWLDNDRYVNFENIGKDVLEDTDSWLELPSGKYAHLN